MTSAPTGWDGLLDEGESILWQGRPVAGLSFHNTDVMSAGMGVFFMGFSIFWMGMAANITGGFNGFGGVFPKLFPLFGIPFFLIGFYNAIGHAFWQAYLRSKTHYTLTSKRAFIATDHPTQGKLLRDYAIDANTDIILKVGPPDSVFFAGKRIGFSRIEDGRALHKMMRQIQKETT
ncbi:hypothetical protein [Planktotalea sp.]|uniref:hypothetical protein n=1 Tax=Planktotalea sp. TaxID=2029877 RepID=UPI003D6AE969